MADQNITALPVTTSPASSDQLLLVGATEEKLIDYDKLADAILTKLTSKQYTLDQGTKTLPAALNELYKASRFDGNIKKVGFRSGQRALNNIYDLSLKGLIQEHMRFCVMFGLAILWLIFSVAIRGKKC